MKKIVVLIPSLNPNEGFIGYVNNLLKFKEIELIIVDDGSKMELKWIFDEIAKNQRVALITHEVNCGKGKSLKDGMEYFSRNFSKKRANGIVTADSDGQHSIQDIISIGRKVNKQNTTTLILGTRNFDLTGVPQKSKSGNKITTRIFKLLYGKKIRDTQTGLRGITRDFIEECLKIKQNRYEFELSMLISAVKRNINIMQCDIETIYNNNNEETHFRPIIDSAKIYKVLFGEFLKFAVSGLSSCVIDIVLFTVLYNLFKNGDSQSLAIGLSTIVARIISSLYNYFFNKNVVFNDNKEKITMVKYYMLCIVQAFMSYVLVERLFYNIGNICPTAIKLVVDTVLFLISFKIQKKWVFRNKKKL